MVKDLKQLTMNKIFKNSSKIDVQVLLQVLAVKLVEGFEESITKNKKFIKMQSILRETNILAIYWKPILSVDYPSTDLEDCDFYWGDPMVVFDNGQEVEANWEDEESLNELFKLINADEDDLDFIKSFLSSNMMGSVSAFAESNYIGINHNSILVDVMPIKDNHYSEAMPKYLGQYMDYLIKKNYSVPL